MSLTAELRTDSHQAKVEQNKFGPLLQLPIYCPETTLQNGSRALGQNR